MAAVPNLFTAVTSATGAQLDANFAACAGNTELAAYSGSSLVGFLQAGSGAVPLTVQSQERMTITPQQFGAIGDGAHAAEDTAAFAALITFVQTAGATRGHKIIIPAGYYNLTAELAFTSTALLHNVYIEGEGKQNTILDFTGSPGGTNGISFNLGVYFGVKNLTILHAPGDGIYIGKGNSGANYSAHYILENIHAMSSGGHNFHFTNTYLGVLNSLFGEANTGDGFRFDGFHTSISGRGCDGSTSSTGNGWTINGMIYSSFEACGAETNAFSGWALSNLCGVTFNGCGAESNQRSAFQLTTSTASAVGVPAAAQDIHGVVFNGCYSLQNSAAGVGTFGEFITASSGDSRPIDFVVMGGDGVPTAAGDRAFILSGASGAVTMRGTGFNLKNYSTANYISGTAFDYTAREGVWTPNQGTGVTLVGSFSSSGTWTKVENQVTLNWSITGSTSVALVAGGQICTNLPFTTAAASSGNAIVSTSCTNLVLSAGNVYSTSAVGATPTIYFSATYLANS